MRNDSRPIFTHSPASPLGGEDRDPPADSRDTVAHGRESHVIHPGTDPEPDGRDAPQTPVHPAPDLTDRSSR